MMALLAFGVTMCFALLPAAASAAGQGDVPVPGGIASVAAAVGITNPPDRPRFLSELVRVVYNGREGRDAAADEPLVQLRSYLARATRGGTDRVPVPLTPALWSEAIFRRPVAEPELFAAVMLDRRAALLAHGLSALDDETIRYLSTRPSLLARLYADNAAAFAAFGDALRIRGGRVVAPGGEIGRAVWEAVIGEPTTSPERFVPKVFGTSEGRVALLYDALFDLDAPRVRFAVGSWIARPDERIRQFRRLVAVSEARHEWVVDAQPFSRPVHDVTQFLTRIRVQPNGAPVAPSTRQFWQRVAGDGIREVALTAPSLSTDVLDAGSLAERLCLGGPYLRADRLDQLSFAQRAFATAPDSQWSDVLVAVRALPRFPMLMLTLERMGVRDPHVYAAAVRQASRIQSLNGRRARAALGQFQGALAIIDRLARVHRVTGPAAEALARSASSVPLRADGAYHGDMARWLEHSLAPALGWPRNADVDVELVSALAGVPERTTDGRRLAFEGRAYRLDLVTSERERLARVREKMRSIPLHAALDVEKMAVALSSPDVSVADVRATAAALAALAASMPVASSRISIDRVVADLSTIRTGDEVKRAAEAADAISALSDDLLAGALMSLVYALAIGPADGMALIGGDSSLRHDFGLESPLREQRARAPWDEPVEVVTIDSPRHVRGSLLGLDLALAPALLIRVDAGRMPMPPKLSTPDREVLIRSVALINPADLADPDRDAIVLAIDRGRNRVAGLSTAWAWDAAADDINMDGWRRRAGQWMLSHDRAALPSLFSFLELIRLSGSAMERQLDVWGMATLASDGCFCTAAPPRSADQHATGRASLGVLAASMADLHLRIAERLGRLHLPASLARGVLFAAVQDFVDHVAPLHPNDWLTLVRTSQAIRDDDIDDYVATLTVDGPLIEDDSAAEADGEARSR